MACASFIMILSRDRLLITRPDGLLHRPIVAGLTRQNRPAQSLNLDLARKKALGSTELPGNLPRLYDIKFANKVVDTNTHPTACTVGPPPRTQH